MKLGNLKVVDQRPYTRNSIGMLGHTHRMMNSGDNLPQVNLLLLENKIASWLPYMPTSDSNI